MKFTCRIIIQLPLLEVVDLWQNREFYDQWQDRFKKIEQIEGSQGTQGARSIIYYQ